MVRKIFKSGNSLVVSLPRTMLRQLGLAEGSTLHVVVHPETKQIILSPLATSSIDSPDIEFVQQVDQFIEQYAAALNALAK